MKPAVRVEDRRYAGILPVAGRDIFAAHQNFSRFRELYFEARQCFPDGTFAELEGVIHADERGGFGEAVALHGGVAEASPEFLGGSGERGASGNYGPEFPAEAAVNGAEAPPAAEEMFAFGRFEIALKFFESAAGREIALDLILERFDEARHGDEDGHALVVNRADYFGGVERVEKHGCAAQNLREENSEKLAKYVAERKEVEKAQRVKEAFPTAVTIDFFFEGFEVGEQVAVGEDDAARFGGGAGGEDDFDGIGALDGRGGKFGRRFLCVGGMQGFEFDDGDAEIFRGSGGEFAADCGCADIGLARDAGWQSCGSAIASIGTATAPAKRQPRNAASHSPEFSPQIRTRSPLAMLCAVRSLAN